MSDKSSNENAPAEPLTRQKVVQAAIQLADSDGIDSLSMRKLGEAVGVKAMSLYNHIANKEDLLDGMVDQVVSEIRLPEYGEDWREAMRLRAHSARDMFARHPWAVTLMETRENPGPASMTYYDAILRCLREAGFSLQLTAHAFAVLDSFIYGFALQELNLPFEDSDDLEELADHILEQMPTDQFPYFSEMITEHTLQPGYSFGDEFEFGLELLLDGLAQKKQQDGAG